MMLTLSIILIVFLAFSVVMLAAAIAMLFMGFYEEIYEEDLGCQEK